MKLTYQIKNIVTGEDYSLTTNPSSSDNIRKFVRENTWFEDNIELVLSENSAKHGIYSVKLSYRPYGYERKTIVVFGVYFGKDVFVTCESLTKAFQLALDKGVISAN